MANNTVIGGSSRAPQRERERERGVNWHGAQATQIRAPSILGEGKTLCSNSSLSENKCFIRVFLRCDLLIHLTSKDKRYIFLMLETVGPTFEHRIIKISPY